MMDLQNAFEEVVDELEKNKVLKKKVTSLSNELDDLKNKYETLKKHVNFFIDMNILFEKKKKN